MNKVVPIEEAQATLADLADAVSAGETIVVTRDGQPAFDIVPHKPVEDEPRKGGLNFEAVAEYKKKHGIDRIVTHIADDFDAPMTDEEFLEIFEPGK